MREGQTHTVEMKTIIGCIIAGIFIITAQSNAQTNTNVATVDFQTLRLQITLKCFTNSDAGGPVDSSVIRLNTKDIIQLLSGRLTFPIGKILNGDGTPIPHRGPGTMTNFSNSAKLMLLQALGTNHGTTYIAVRDGHPRVDYDVSDYFTINKRGFEEAGTNEVVGANANTNNPDTTAVYLEEVTFDNLINGGGGDRVAFAVDGFTRERRGPVTVKTEVIDDSASKNLNSSVAGTGSIAGNFTVIQGTIGASGPQHETK
jgi:hypothetical protein